MEMAHLGPSVDFQQISLLSKKSFLTRASCKPPLILRWSLLLYVGSNLDRPFFMLRALQCPYLMKLRGTRFQLMELCLLLLGNQMIHVLRSQHLRL